MVNFMLLFPGSAQDPENVKAFIIPIEHKQGPMPSPLNNTYTSNVVYRNVLI